jgi:ADP-ribosylglycohydrolase
MRTTVEVARANGDNEQATLDEIWKRMDGYHCVHAINNACVVAAGLMHGGHDLGRVICTTVMGGWDTDCTGATAGSIAGTMIGAAGIDARWKTPFNDTLHTSIEGRREQKISALVEETRSLAERFRA